MTIMTPTRRPKLTDRNGRAAVYRSKTAVKEPLWRDIVAGLVFFTVLLIGGAVLLVGGLTIFG